MEANKPYQFKPSEVAQMTGTSPQTVRRWSELFPALLSESANPATGTPRLYTWADVEVIKQIKALRDQNVAVELIPDRLSRPTMDLTTVTTIEAHQDATEAPGQAPAPLVAQDYLIAIERRFEALEQSSRAGWWWLVAGIAIGLGLAGIAELFALVARR